ncbi:hypothetical protein J3A64_001861 [Pseudarthrobacter sp. PvP004]|uniref:HEPN domain-containing protein n=1 Tax=Pseudarthrobacter sp. PvP004 TaxID=2817850 RepID=UPI001AE4C982|nr:HEPN domain-containing protein [Pseudarthrobacter sp. PvP004]MBP2266397.1 hypothetical protein [Pseudarthrobacter sp. PvP004]
MNEDITGTFWVENGPGVAGTLTMGESDYSLELEGFCFQPQSIEIKPGYYSISGDPGAVAADFAPRTVMGELGDGTKVTLLGAHMDTPDQLFGPLKQKFTGTISVVGAHIKDQEHKISGIRWTWNISPGQAGWLTEDPVHVTDGPLSGTLSPRIQAQSPGLGLQLSTLTELRVARNGAAAAMTQLLVLWTGKTLDVSSMEIQLEDGRWLTCSPPEKEGGRFTRSSLLPLNELTLQALARWATVAFKLDPLPYIASASAGVLQIDAQAVASALEGLHRRLHGDNRPLAPLSKAVVKKATRAARDAGVAVLVESGFEDAGLAGKLFTESLNHIDQPSYHQRLTEMAAPVVAMAPGLCGPDLTAWVKAMKDIRNDQSHQMLDHFHEDDVAVYHIASISARWVLRLRILMEFVEPSRLATALKESQSFAFALANMDVENYWEGYSCLQAFRREPSTPKHGGRASSAR